MQLIGETVQHKTFGRGVVTDCCADALTVEFSDHSQKKFIYPDAFRQQFLTVISSQGKQELSRELARQEELKEAHFEKLEARMEQESLLTNLRISPCSQGAFDTQDPDETFRTWTVCTGFYLSGYAKGSARIPDRMKPNSLCLVTGRPGNCAEHQRQILGAFMVQEDFIGSGCQDGCIAAHPDYRIRLEKPLPYWPYITDDPTRERWGRAGFKYLKNTLVERILCDMRRQLHGTEAAERMEALYDYYCRRNQLPSRPLIFD